MKLEVHSIGNENIIELLSEEMIISSLDEALDLLGNIYYQGFDKLILHEKNLSAGFFDLKTKLAGEILQKFSNYKVRLAIVGDFEKYNSRSLRDFIFESNKGKQANFVNSFEEAIIKLSN